MNRVVKITIFVLIAIVLIAAVIFYFLLRTKTPSPNSVANFFGFGNAISVTPNNGPGTNVPQVGNQTAQKVFKISDGPVAGATFIQTFSPTTTNARYVMADNGHVLDLALDVSGTVARPVSNTTIPGITSAQWASQGRSLFVQYLDTGVRKTVYMAFATTTATSSIVTPTQIRFLPSNITSFAVAPNSSGISYLLKTTSGVDGYVGKLDGTAAQKIFSLPLSQVLLSWPSLSTLFVQTKYAAGVPGVAYAVDIKTGAASPLLYALGLTASANNTFSKVVYQTTQGAGNLHQTYSHDTKSGEDIDLPFNPFPEKCIWSSISLTVLYCATPSAYVDNGYLDLWHQGLISTADGIYKYDVYAGATSLVVIPGSGNGAPTGPIEQMSMSPDGNYLLFITRGSQALWGVRL